MAKLSIDNFRDMGGLETPYGKIKSGMLFRTSALYAKSRADRRFIDALRLDAIVDFRTQIEADENPDYVPQGVEYLRVPILNEETGNALVFTKKTKTSLLSASKERMDELVAVVGRSYLEMPFADGYNRLFERMDEGKKIAFHCTAGKDRTGIAALIIELAFGRDFDTALKEYMLSNVYRAKTNRKIHILLKILRAPDYSVNACLYAINNHEQNFEIAKDAILSRYGTTQNYLEKVFGITPDRIERWRKFYIA